ncbi:MAG: tyrosine recombinase [Bacilli bacterium]|nr:tyrosine recombinase [Bacilli bacterium]
MIINEYLKDYLDYLIIDKKYSNNTKETYQRHLYKFNQYCYQSNINIIKVNRNDIVNYLKTLNELDSKSVANIITTLKGFYKYLIIEKIITKNPLEFIDTPKIKKSIPSVMSSTDVNAILKIELKNKYDYRNKAMLELMYATGLRISELVNLTFANIDTKNKIIRVTGKGNKERTIPLADYTNNYLIVYLSKYRQQFKCKNSNYLFITNHTEKMTRANFFIILQKIAEKQGIKTHPHILRYSFATHMLDNGADLRVIQSLLGHESIATTQIYTHVSQNKLKENYLKSHPHA